MLATCDTPHHKLTRQIMKRNYYENGGRVKSLLKYYTRKFKEDEEAQSILNNTRLTFDERLKEIKLYNFTKNMDKLGI